MLRKKQKFFRIDSANFNTFHNCKKDDFRNLQLDLCYSKKYYLEKLTGDRDTMKRIINHRH